MFRPAFTVVTTWVTSTGEYREKCVRMLEAYGWKLLDGVNLDQLIAQRTPIPLPLKLVCATQACSAFEDADALRQIWPSMGERYKKYKQNRRRQFYPDAAGHRRRQNGD